MAIIVNELIGIVGMDARVPYLLGAAQSIVNKSSLPSRDLQNFQVIETVIKIVAAIVVAAIANVLSAVTDSRVNSSRDLSLSKSTVLIMTSTLCSFIKYVVWYEIGALLGSRFLSLSNGNLVWASVHTLAVCGIFQCKYYTVLSGLAQLQSLHPKY